MELEILNYLDNFISLEVEKQTTKKNATVSTDTE